MATLAFYVEDIVKLKSNSNRIGQVDRTSSDVSTHTPNVLGSYQIPIHKGAGITRPVFKKFLDNGIPPRGLVLVNWVTLPWQDDTHPILIRETELELVDRSLLAGDIVKRKLSDAMSGTIIETSTTVSLVQPTHWPPATSRPSSHSSSDDDKFGNYMLRPEDMVHGVSTEDLRPASEWPEGEFVMYKGWIGRIQETYEEVYLRLNNGSVVVVEDPEELDTHTPDDMPSVGDFVRTKKANLRRGRWIYGSYDPNIEPAGFVADVRVQSLEVQWLAGTDPAQMSLPHYEVDHDAIANGEVALIDRTRTPRQETNSDLKVKKVDLDICVGDTVRFSEISGAAVKYHSNRILSTGQAAGQLHRIPRTDSLGFDINVFMVAATQTEVQVLWQDQSTSAHSSTELEPYLEMDESGDVWPGEIVAKKTAPEPGFDVIKPTSVGVVQTTDAKNRLAQVRWFNDPNVSYTVDDGIGTILPGSSTGDLNQAVEDVSIYEIGTLPGLERRLGDFVAMMPIEQLQNTVAGRPELKDYCEAVASMNSPQSKLNPFAEVIELGLDGLITIRLLAVDPVRDIKLPWEATWLLASTDDDIEDDMLETMDVDYSSDTDFASDDMSVLDDLDGSAPWVDDDENVVEGQDDWETDDEDNDSTGMPEPDELSEAKGAHEDGVDRAHGLASEDTPKEMDALPIETTMSYENMFANIESEEQPRQFAVLDSPVPSDHAYYHSSSVSMNGALLRRIQKEHKILQSSLPAGVFVRTWESRLNILRVLILGPLQTPYAFAPFVIDMHLDESFPSSPPKAFFHSWTSGLGPINPNLYEDGKICLSLLGTWPGDTSSETWSTKSTILQVLVSILGLVLVNEPYYNEAGYDVRVGTAAAKIPSELYSEQAYFRSRGFIEHALTKGVSCFENELKQIYLPTSPGSPQMLRQAILDALRVVRRSTEGQSVHVGQRRVSKGALIPLRKQIERLLALLSRDDTASAETLTKAFHDATQPLPDFPLA